MHIEHKNIAPRRHRSCLNNELRRFLNSHEIAGNLWVCNSNRATHTYLPAKQRHNRPRRPEHIAKPNHAKQRGRFIAPANSVRRLNSPLRERLQYLFGKTFSRSHVVGRTHGFIGGDENEILYSALLCCLRGSKCTENIIAHSFYNIVLNHRHLLVGCHMVDGLNFISLHHITHKALAAH